jgi:hypothetical protein
VANVARDQRRSSLEADAGLHGISDIDRRAGRTQLAEQRAGSKCGPERQGQAGCRQERVDGSRVARITAPKGELEGRDGRDPEARCAGQLIDELPAGASVAKVIDEDV